MPLDRHSIYKFVVLASWWLRTKAGLPLLDELAVFQDLLCCRCSLVSLNVRQRSEQFVRISLGLSTCLFLRHPCISSFKGLQWPFFSPFSFIMALLAIDMTGSNIPTSFESENNSNVWNSKQNVWLAVLATGELIRSFTWLFPLWWLLLHRLEKYCEGSDSC